LQPLKQLVQLPLQTILPFGLSLLVFFSAPLRLSLLLHFED
jgi:hypothetical protein